MYTEYKAYIPQATLPATAVPPISSPIDLQPTPADIEGPFYKAGAPVIASGVIGLPEKPDDLVLRVSGRVTDTKGAFIEHAVLDIWQANHQGVYDNVGYTLRGKITADKVGRYSFETIVPGDYQIADNPPDFRCAHIHVKVTAEGYKPLTTQLYFPNDPYDATDHWFDKRRVIQIPDGLFNFVLEKLGV
jgi:catechol 1,2-dioxygenase